MGIRGRILRWPEGTAGEQTANSVCQSAKAEGRNAEEALRDDQQRFSEDVQRHFLVEEGGGEVSRGGHRYDQVLQPRGFERNEATSAFTARYNLLSYAYCRVARRNFTSGLS